jgi:hypothetical protein
MNNLFDLKNIPMGNTPILEGSLSVDHTGRTVSVRFRPINGGPLDNMTIAGFDLTDPNNHLVFASLTETDHDGFYSTTFTISEETTAIQIQASPEYGSFGELNSLPAISVEW